MAKFHGVIGYALATETAPGVFTNGITERPCSGEMLRNTKRWEPNGQVNDNLTISNTFSILSDEFTALNIGNMRYLTWQGIKWKISGVEIQHPRIILSLGAKYNG